MFHRDLDGDENNSDDKSYDEVMDYPDAFCCCLKSIYII